MSNTINFKELTDLELKTLLFEGLKEAFTRQGQMAIEAIELAKVVRDEYSVSEIMEANKKAEIQIKREKENQKAKDEAERQAKLWEKKKKIALKLSEFFEGDTDLTVNVWNSNTSEKRVYLNMTSWTKRSKSPQTIACLYVTGNSKNKPMSLECNIELEDKEGLKNLLSEIGNAWNSLRLDIASAL